MAFTGAQKVKIRFYLGWGARYQTASSELEQAIATIENAGDTDSEDFIGELLTSLDSCWSELEASWPRLKAAEVGPIKLALEKEIGLRSREGARLCQALGKYMNVEVIADVFSVAPGGYAPRIGTGGYFKHG